MSAIVVDNLTKHYGEIAANDSISFTVDQGEIFGYLGPNGAGKTTTIRILLGLISPTKGSASILGAPIDDRRALQQAKQRIGYLPDNLSVDDQFTGRQLLNYFGRLRGQQRREELLELFHPPLDRPVEEYSSGNRRMLGIVLAFMHDPDLIIMDEPTAGLDPLKQDRLHQFLEQERKQGKTIFFSSHVLSEVQRVCDRVGIIRNGGLVALEEVELLLKRSGKTVWVQLEESGSIEAFVTEEMTGVDITDNSVRFTYTGSYNDLIEHLGTFDIADVEIKEPPLEEVFMHYYDQKEVPT